MTEHREGRLRSQERSRAEREVEGDHVAVEQARSASSRSTRAIQPQIDPRRRRLPRISCTHGRESVRRGESTRREQDCDEDPPGFLDVPCGITRQRVGDPDQVQEGSEDTFRVHHRALRRVFPLAEGCSPLHRRSSRRGRVPDGRGARPPRFDLFIDRRPLLPGTRLRGLSGASAGRDRGVPLPARRERRRPRRARSSTSTTPSSRRHSPPTTATSRTRSAISAPSRSRRASKRSRAPTA